MWTVQSTGYSLMCVLLAENLQDFPFLLNVQNCLVVSVVNSKHACPFVSEENKTP